jgi:hypothetical protein
MLRRLVVESLIRLKEVALDSICIHRCSAARVQRTKSANNLPIFTTIPQALIDCALPGF